MMRALLFAMAIGSAAAAAEKTISLEVEASTWRDKRKPFDVKKALAAQLARAGVAVGKDGPDGELSVRYDEEKGKGYKALGDSGAPSAWGTNIALEWTLSKEGKPLLSLSVKVEPDDSFVQGDLYRHSLEQLKARPELRFAGVLIAAALGVPSALPKILPALCGDTHAAAAKLIEAAGYKPASKTEEAWIAVGEGNYDRCVELGKAAVEPIIDCARRPRPPPFSVDDAAVRALAAIGDARATPLLLEALAGDPSFHMMDMQGAESMGDGLVPLVEALGKTGDGRALPQLDAFARKKTEPKLSAAARAAAKQIRSRSKSQ